MNPRPKCIGLAGWLFGHQFIKSTWEWEYRSNYCYRCGYRRGCDDE